jgi:hypothetical protein
MHGWDLLWENASPTSSYAANTESLDLSNYDAVFLIYRNWPSNDYEYGFITVIGMVGQTTMVQLVSQENKSGWRKATTAASGVTFTDCHYNAGIHNDYCVPLYIYGIKGVSNS